MRACVLFIAVLAISCESTIELVLHAQDGSADERRVLFVTGLEGSEAYENDDLLRGRLVAEGFEVDFVPYDSVSDIPPGTVLVVLSSGIHVDLAGAEVAAPFVHATVPMIVMESVLFSELGMAASHRDVDYGAGESLEALDIVDPRHPIAADLAGEVRVHTSASWHNWALAGNSGTVIAVLPDNPQRTVIFAFEAGATMPGGTAPARRVGFFLRSEYLSSLTDAGSTLLDAAIAWALERR